MAEIITPTTKLQAVNQMLRGINEAPVSTLTGDVGLDVKTATQTLDAILLDVQTEGWLFNTEHEFPLTRDLSGEIAVPANALKVDIRRNRFGGIDPVQRGPRVYDRKNHTYTFDQNLEATIVFAFAFEELPHTARYYITYRAVRQYQSEAVGSPTMYQLSEMGEVRARSVFLDDQAEDENLSILDTPDFQKLR